MDADRKQMWVDFVPHTKHLGMEVLEMQSGRARIRQPYRTDLIGDPERGVLHGGVITTLMDMAGGAAVWSRGDVTPQATLDLRIDYLRAAAPPKDLFAHAECYRVGSHVAFVRGLCHDGDLEDPVAAMTATFALKHGERREYPA